MPGEKGLKGTGSELNAREPSLVLPAKDVPSSCPGRLRGVTNEEAGHGTLGLGRL